MRGTGALPDHRLGPGPGGNCTGSGGMWGDGGMHPYHLKMWGWRENPSLVTLKLGTQRSIH